MRHFAFVVAVMASLGAISGVMAEFCDPYIDRQNQLQEGFRCPVKEIVPSGGKNFNGEESYCCGSCIYKFCCNTIENRVDQSDCDLGEIRRSNMLSPPTFTANSGGGGGGGSTKPQNISLKGGKVRSSKGNEFEVIDPMDDGSTKFGSGGGGGGGSAGGKNGGKEDPKGKKGFVDIVKDGVKIKLDQAIEDAKGGDIGSVIGVIVAGVFTVIVSLVAVISCVICCCRKSKSKRQQWRQGGGPGAPGVKRSLSSASLHHGAEGKGESKRHSALYPSIPNTPMNTNGRYSSAGRLSKVRDYISYSLPHSRGREPRQPLWGHEGSRESFNAQAFFSRQQMRNLQDRYPEGDSDESATATPSPVHRAISASKSRSRGGHCNTIHGGAPCNCHHGGGGGGSCGGACGGGNHHGGCGGGGDGGVRPQSCCVGGYGGGNGGNFPPPPPQNMGGQPGGFNMPNGMVPQAFANPYAYPNPAMVPFSTGGNHHHHHQQQQQHNVNLPPSMIASYPPPSHTPSAMSPFVSSGLYPQVSQALDASGSSIAVPAASPLPPPPPPESSEGATQPTAPPPTGSLTQPPAFNPHYV